MPVISEADVLANADAIVADTGEFRRTAQDLMERLARRLRVRPDVFTQTERFLGLTPGKYAEMPEERLFSFWPGLTETAIFAEAKNTRKCLKTKCFRLRVPKNRSV